MNYFFDITASMNFKTYAFLHVLVITLTIPVLLWMFSTMMTFKSNLKDGLILTVQSSLIIFAMSFSLLSISDSREYEKYSQKELGDLILTENFVLKRIVPENDLVSLGKTVLIKSKIASDELGVVRCETVSFKECVADIKSNKEKILVSLENSNDNKIVQIDFK